MMFLCNSRMRPGVAREQLVEHLKQGADKEEWKLVRKGIVSHWLFKVGDQPGFIAIINCDSLDEARAIVDKSPLVQTGLVEFDIEPVDLFPHFD